VEHLVYVDLHLFHSPYVIRKSLKIINTSSVQFCSHPLANCTFAEPHRLPHIVDGRCLGPLDSRLLFSPFLFLQYLTLTFHPRDRVWLIVVSFDELVQHVYVALGVVAHASLVEFWFHRSLKRSTTARFTSEFMNILIYDSPSSNLPNVAFRNSFPLSVCTASGLWPLLPNVTRKVKVTSSPYFNGLVSGRRTWRKRPLRYVGSCARRCGQRAYARYIQLLQIVHVIHDVVVSRKNPPRGPVQCKCPVVEATLWSYPMMPPLVEDVLDLYPRLKWRRFRKILM
jgi:hypothetical protein